MLNFPDLNLPEKGEVRDKWAKQILDGAAGIADSRFFINWRNRYQENFNKFKGLIPEGDYEHVINTFGSQFSKPTIYGNYPLLEPLIMQLVGEYSAKDIPFAVHKINKNAVSEKMNMVGSLLFEQMAKPYWDAIEKKMGVKLPIEKKMDALPDGAKKYMNYNYRDMEEEVMFNAIEYLKYRHRLGDEYGRILLDILINNDGFGKIEWIDGDPVPRRVSNLRALFNPPPDDYVWRDVSADMEWFGEDLAMSYDEVVHTYGPRMKPEDLKKFKKNVDQYRRDGRYLGWNINFKNYWYNDIGVLMIRVIDIQVKVQTEKTFKLNTDKMDPSIERRTDTGTVSEVWNMFKIGHDIYDYSKKKNQIPIRDNYRDMQLDYFGVLTQYSFYRKAYPLQLLYNTLHTTFDFLCNQAGGKAIEIDLANIPDGYKPNDIAYMAKVQGLILRQRKEGDLNGGKPISGEVDFGLSNSISQLFAAMGVCERTAERITGVTPGRQGLLSSDTTNGVASQNLIQSTFATQPIFDALRLVTEQGLQRSCDLIRYTWDKDETRSYFMGDMGMKVLKVPATLRNYNYGLFVVNNMEDKRNKEWILSMGEKVLSTDASMYLEIVKMFNAGSSIEAEKILESAMTIIRNQQQQIEQSKLELQKQGNEIASRANDLKEKELEIKASVPLQVAEIQKSGNLGAADVNKQAKENVADIMSKGNIDKEALKGHNSYQVQQAALDQQPEEATTEAQ